METLFSLRKEPFALLLLTTIVLLFALSLRPLSDVDMQGKLMFGVPVANMIWIMPCFLICLWALYWVARRFLYSPTVTWIHVVTTVVSTIVMVSVLYLSMNPSPAMAEQHQLVGNVIQVVTLFFVAGQIAFIGNVVLGLIRRQRVI